MADSSRIKMDLGRIIILNGVPRSGKSSIAQAIQDSFDGPWVNLGVDQSIACTVAHYLPGVGLRPYASRPDLEPMVCRLFAALYESIAGHSRLGLNVVVDAGHHDAYSTPLGILRDSARRLAGLPVLFVGVLCPDEVIVARRRDTGWDAGRPADHVRDLVRIWNREVHKPGIYDLTVDTSALRPHECAEASRAM